MAIHDVLAANPSTSLFTISALFLLVRSLYRVYFHPLAHIPGPLLPKLTSLWLHYHAYIGDEASTIHRAHQHYGPLVRVSPVEVDIADADAIPSIYISKGGFPKAPCYSNFDIDGHQTIFSTTDTEHRAVRAKAVAPLFSTKSIKENEQALYGCVDHMVRRMRAEAETGKPVNLLNIARSLALDAVSTHLFQENYNGTAENGSLSASPFVDAFVAVGRFFYLPNAVFIWAEWLSEKTFPSEHTKLSMQVVDRFVDSLVMSTAKGALNYPGRLLSAGISLDEAKVQCKDLIFAGTDSTGMNLAIICRQLALHPDKYEALRAEVTSNSCLGSTRQELHSLPYLSAVVREGLRLSMANPTRLPHIVPVGGWSFKGTFFPTGTVVGCSAHELHFNATAFPNAPDFQPERWLKENVDEEANKYWFAFGAGSRACIARNLATMELLMATEKLAESGVLTGAKVCQEEVEIFEWFNSSVKGERIDLIWEKPVA